MAAAAGGFRLGQRVHAAGDPRRSGTVRYLGPVDGHAGDWVGVDWDGGAGGRHDGSLAGRRYFSAAGERSASFARPASLSAGIALPDAIRLRYRVDDFTKEEEGACACRFSFQDMTFHTMRQPPYCTM